MLNVLVDLYSDNPSRDNAAASAQIFAEKGSMKIRFIQLLVQCRKTFGMFDMSESVFSNGLQQQLDFHVTLSQIFRRDFLFTSTLRLYSDTLPLSKQQHIKALRQDFTDASHQPTSPTGREGDWSIRSCIEMECYIADKYRNNAYVQ